MAARQQYAEDYQLPVSLRRRGDDSDEEEDEEEGGEEHAVDQQYFDSYGADINVTRVMLADEPRMRFYDAAIRAANVRDKVVLDVGCGTGVLSMMAARAGARRVIGIDASVMAITAQHVVRANGYSNCIRILQMKAEDVTLGSLRAAGALGEGETVDFIVSEWMGFYLVHEHMLASVVAVRDALKTAQMIPRRAVLYGAPVDLGPFFEAAAGEAGPMRPFWRNRAGFDLSIVGRIEEATLLDANPLVLQMPPACQLTEAFVVRDFDLNTVDVARDLTSLEHKAVVSWGQSTMARAAAAAAPATATLWGVGLWFTVFGDNGTCMPSGPSDEATHWKQTVVLLPAELRENLLIEDFVVNGQEMEFKLNMALNALSRSYEISLELSDPTM